MLDRGEHHLDASGLTCPEPVMLLHGVVRDAQKGDRILVTATDPSTVRDIPKFCDYLGHSLIDSHESEGVFSFEIVKG